MSSHYLFHEAGCIPGVPGIFANCRVDIDDDGVLHQSPLSLPVDAAPVEEEAQPEAPQEDAKTDVAPEPAPSESVSEPESASEPTSLPAFFNGG